MTGFPLEKLKGPWRITFDTNPNLCNLRCIMCEQNSIYRTTKKEPDRVMDFDIIHKVIESVANCGLREIIPSTMGEPLLYPQFVGILDLIKEFDLKLNLTTNGTFPKFDVSTWGELILPIASDVKISINGAKKETAESIMTNLNFDKQLSNIVNFIRIRDEIREKGINFPTVTFQVTYIEKNFDELGDLLKLAIKLNIDRFKGHHLWLTWPELEDGSLRRNADSVLKWNNLVKKLQKIAQKYRLRNGKKIILDNLYEISGRNLEGPSPEKWICPFLGREAWIAWDGIFNVCCAPDDLRKSLGYFGNVNDSDFMELWNHINYNKLIENWGNYSLCENCNMKRPLKDIRGC